VRYAGDDVEVQVTDDGGDDRGDHGGDGAASGGTPLDADGRGVAGMAERATAYGGELVAGPRPDGTGWRVRARLRLATEPATEPSAELSAEEGSPA
jgi:signal transduction histidine kinase